MTGNMDSTAVATFVESLEGHALAWMPDDMTTTDSMSYIVALASDEVREIEDALNSFKNLGLDGDAVNRVNFPLPTVGAKLDAACHEVHDGKGFATIRGLDPDRYSAEDNLVMYLGLADYIGNIRGVQDRRGTVLTHVTEAKSWTTPAQHRHGIHTTGHLQWHTDMGADVLALHVRATADRGKGGETYVASSWTICRELLTKRPDVLETLQQPSWPVQITGTPPQYVEMPLMKIHQNRIYFAVDPGRLGLHHATVNVHPLVPGLTLEQREALEVLANTATKYQLCLDVKRGDFIFINNWALLHARNAYHDSQVQRHLVRLWLRSSRLGWEVPESLRLPWEAAFGPNGDGNPVFRKGGRRGAVQKKYPVAPTIRYRTPKFNSGSAAFLLDDGDVNAASSESDA